MQFNIELWGSVAALVVSVFAIIIIFLTRKNIVDILEKDVILFDKNFEMKKQALEHSFNLLDRVKQNPALYKDKAYREEAKACFNELMCTVNNLNIAHAFRNMALKGANIPLSKYKLLCRADLGLQNKHSGKIKKGEADINLDDYPTKPEFVQPVPSAPKPVEPVTVKPAEPVAPVKPVAAQPVRPFVSAAKPVAPVKPVAPAKPVARPAEKTAAKPVEPVKKRTTKE